MLEYLSADIICSEKRSSSKTVSFEEQIMSKDKYPSIFSNQKEAIVFVIHQIFFATRAVLKIGESNTNTSQIHFFMFQHVIIIVVSDPPTSSPPSDDNIGTTEVSVPFKRKLELSNGELVRSVWSNFVFICSELSR